MLNGPGHMNIFGFLLACTAAVVALQHSLPLYCRRNATKRHVLWYSERLGIVGILRCLPSAACHLSALASQLPCYLNMLIYEWLRCGNLLACYLEMLVGLIGGNGIVDGVIIAENSYIKAE